MSDLHGTQEGKRLNDHELVEAFKAGEVAGQDIMERLLGKIGLAHRSQESLQRADGTKITGENGEPYRVIDYITVAEKHQHPKAVTIILGIVGMDEQSPKFPIACDAIAGIVNGYLPAEGS